MGALDSMLSQYRSNAPSPVASMPNTMPTAPKAPSVEAPNSFFSGVPSPPDIVGAGATSRGMSPFGMQTIPDLSNATPQQRRLIAELGNVTYSLPLGGYIYTSTANDPTSAYVRGYFGRPMTGGQFGANQLAKRIYDLIGSFPTRAVGTSALNQLTGGMPATGPSLNSRSPGGSYAGPFQFPGWNSGNNFNI